MQIGHVSETLLLEFTLDTAPGVAMQKYTAWFHTWDDLDEEVLYSEQNSTAPRASPNVSNSVVVKDTKR